MTTNDTCDRDLPQQTSLPPREAIPQLLSGLTHPLTGAKLQLREAGSTPRGTLRYVGSVLSAHGSRIGHLERKIGVDRAGRLTARHLVCEIAPRWQRKGIGSWLLGQFLTAYRELGIQKVRLCARGVGSYAWALAGFEFDVEQAPWLDRETLRCELAQRIFEIRKPVLWGHVGAGHITHEQLWELEHLCSQPDVSPFRLALFGRERSWRARQGGELWAGKVLMLHARWPGVLRLGHPADSAKPRPA